MWNIIFILYGIFGLVIIITIIKKPTLIKPILIGTMVGTAGLAIYGRQIVDEYFLLIILFAIVLLIFANKLKLVKTKTKKWDKIHQWVFFVMILYMLLETFRSMILYGDLRIFRWIIYYAMLGILAFFLTHNNLPKLSREKTSLIIGITSLVFLIIYFSYGFIFEIFHGPNSRWALQGMEWPQTTNAVFALFVAIPSAIFLIKNKKYVYKTIGLFIFIAGFAIAYYYDSLTTFITMFAFLIVAPTVFSLRKIVVWFSIFSILILSLSSIEYSNHLPSKALGVILNKPSENPDVRYLHFIASFASINNSAIPWLFGYGADAHKFILVPHLQKLYNRYLPGTKTPAAAQTTGFTAILVDSGWIGLLLLLANFALTGRRILMQKNKPGKIILLLSLGITGCWLTITHGLAVVLFYFIIMPEGLLIQLSSAQTNENRKNA